jgi:hypothetical protein
MDSAGRFLLKDKQTGKILPLRGYGALRDEHAARKGIDLTKPIYEQVISAKKKAQKPSAASSTRSTRRK